MKDGGENRPAQNQYLSRRNVLIPYSSVPHGMPACARVNPPRLSVYSPDFGFGHQAALGQEEFDERQETPAAACRL